jgi:hypothetical protein
MKKPLYATEADLCADFIAWVKREDPQWTPYAETAGWDILLVAADGTQIGVQAKLKFNMKVLAQTIPDKWDHWHDRGPDFRAVLVPEYDGTHSSICGALGLTFFSSLNSYGDNKQFSPSVTGRFSNEPWHYWNPRARCKLPDFVPDVAAGASAPVQLTQWKVGALRIVATLQVRGYITRQDFKEHGIDPRRWTGSGDWLKPGERPGEFVRGHALDFDSQHPQVFEQILEEVRKKLAVRGEFAREPRPHPLCLEIPGGAR